MTALPHAELLIRVQPRASRTEVAGERDGRLLVRVTAPPVEGKANDAVRALLAKRLRVARSKVEIVSGEGARVKKVRVAGLTTEAAKARLLEP